MGNRALIDQACAIVPGKPQRGRWLKYNKAAQWVNNWIMLVISCNSRLWQQDWFWCLKKMILKDDPGIAMKRFLSPPAPVHQRALRKRPSEISNEWVIKDPLWRHSALRAVCAATHVVAGWICHPSCPVSDHTVDRMTSLKCPFGSNDIKPAERAL